MLLGGVLGVGYAYSLTIISVEDEINEQISNSCFECSLINVFATAMYLTKISV